MFHIIFMLLKIIGIILLVLLGIFVFLILMISFVPIRYSALVQKNASINAGANIYWLLHFVDIRLQFTNGKVTFSFSIFGKNLLGEKKSNSKTKKPEKKIPSYETGLSEEDMEEKVIDQEETDNQMAKKEDIQDEDILDECIEEKPVIISSVNKEKTSKEVREKHVFKSLKEKLIHLRNTIINFVKNLKEKISNIADTLERTKQTIHKYSDFWHLPATQDSFRHICGELKYLLRHIMPRNATGYVYFGFEDPATTGEILGLLYLVTIFLPNTFVLEPDFEKKVLECDVKIVGHIRICHFIKIILGLFIDSNVRKTFFAFRKLRTIQ